MNLFQIDFAVSCLHVQNLPSHTSLIFGISYVQSAGLPWTVAKGQDTFTPISAVVRNLILFSIFTFSWSYFTAEGN